MMFELTGIQKAIQNAARDFASRELRPFAAQIDENGSLQEGILQKLADAGFMGVALPEQWGGTDAGSVAYALVMMEIASGCASTAVTMSVTNMVNEIIARFGTDAQRSRYCNGISNGELQAGAFALSEVDAGSDPGGIRTLAKREGAGWVIDGGKQWISNAPYAGVFIVWARTNEAASGSRGLSCFLVDHGTKGLVIGKRENKMGLRGSATAALQFDGCHVRGDALLGAEGEGFKIAMAALDGGRIGIAAQSIGIAAESISSAIAYAKERIQFGQPIANFQSTQWKVADSVAELDAARLLTVRAASLKERELPFSTEASMAKLYASESAWRICNRAIQMLGGYGYTREFPQERHLRDVRVAQIYEGTSEIQRLVIARNILSYRRKS